MKSIYIVRYSEIGLKGGNRDFFENALVRNIRGRIKRKDLTIRKIRGRILIEGVGESEPEIEVALQETPGVKNFSRADLLEKDLEVAKKRLFKMLREVWDEKENRSFRVRAKRSDKSYEKKSVDLEVEIGSYMMTNTKGPLRVDLSNPEVELNLEIHSDGFFVYVKKHKGIGGLPVGTSGEVMCLLSGGIDSPVAAWLMMKRGCRVHYIFFENKVFLGRAAYHKVLSLRNRLANFQGFSSLSVVPFSDIQVEIRDNCFERNRVILYRRFMMRIAEKVAESKGLQTLVTGENIGQVASQTLENMRVVNDMVKMPIFRPLITYDKEEIIDLSKKIGTFETSVVDAPDCCSVFMPKRPATKARRELLERDEEALDVEALVNAAIEGITDENDS